jgi:hypothetical protein
MLRVHSEKEIFCLVGACHSQTLVVCGGLDKVLVNEQLRMQEQSVNLTYCHVC